MVYRNWSDEELWSVLQKADSMADALRILGLDISSGNYRSIKNAVERNDWVLPKFPQQNRRRGSDSVKRPIEDYLSNKFPAKSHGLKLRLIREGFFKRKCYSCNLTEWMGQPIPIHLEHIDGNHFNNNLENLTILCANCHNLTETYAGKNIANQTFAIQSLCECGKKKARQSKICKECSSVLRLETEAKKINWPSMEELQARLAESNYSALARELGVSDNAIRKHIQKRVTTK